LLPAAPSAASLLLSLGPSLVRLALVAAVALRYVLFALRRSRAAAALRAAGLPLVAWRPALPWRLYRSSRRSLLDAVRARAAAAGHGAFGASSQPLHPASPVPQRPCSSSLTAPGARAGAVVGEHAFVHVACPALARAALAGGATKAPFYSAFKGFVGEGLFTAEGEDWRVPARNTVDDDVIHAHGAKSRAYTRA
jgi:hypothetical protein